MFGEKTRNYKLTADKTAVVMPTLKWIAIGSTTPRGVKLMLISRKYGVAQMGQYNPDETFFTHWHPLPTFGETK